MKDDEQMKMALNLVRNRHPLHTLEVDTVLPILNWAKFSWCCYSWDRFDELERQNDDSIMTFSHSQIRDAIQIEDVELP